ncbi:hypothetical protein [Caulobacter sp. RL271]|jgi:hypothetical protein|uniref:Uncharacterized protein n=1 Tax=Caulobacter segnis TaxID=88688 RepID=A0ABY4ZYR1_9CAUL|nr:hypothetical protein [Caulobacter segnis]USQ97122.1 hypothetical protein MZV50_06100 [Caulobacter segnis]
MSDTDTPARSWCETLQKKLMDAIDAAWAMIEHSNDPAVLAKAREKARLAGQLAVEARRISALVPPPRENRPRAAPTILQEALARIDAEPPPAPPPVRAPAAQAAAMQAALARMGRR